MPFLEHPINASGQALPAAEPPGPRLMRSIPVNIRQKEEWRLITFR
ncbi:hypothetical protein PMI34_03954 [Pseudomonas sp. GM74]|nr:hypothetical protein PMI34_03954 [Pseudomonas sp. GM74]